MRIVKAILPSGKVGYKETNIQQRARQRDPLILGKAGSSLTSGVSEPEVLSKNPGKNYLKMAIFTHFLTMFVKSLKILTETIDVYFISKMALNINKCQVKVIFFES